ncbi:hypothetical protein BKA62DRAFT_463201 [Auriculariales sp. MPI-PUGE-AT-0066]|nr:hypothetical protein BKA62DRAFT_463201 [Auriculariales sp. MPI-PUGE-AT-0066]
MSTASLHFGPEWMRAKPAHVSRPSPAQDTSGTGSPALSYSSSLHSIARADVAVKYSKEDLLQIWKDMPVQPELSSEVERWDGVVGDDVQLPLGLSEPDDNEKKILFSQTLNSELRRRQSQDTLSLAMPGTSPAATKFAPSSPIRERPFGALINRRRGDSNAEQPGLMPRRLSLSQSAGLNGPMSPSIASPRTRDGWLSRKKSGLDGTGNVVDSDNPIDVGQPAAGDSDVARNLNGFATHDASSVGDGQPGSDTGPELNGNLTPPRSSSAPTSGLTLDQLPDPATTKWHYKDPSGNVQGPFDGKTMAEWHGAGYFLPELPMKRVEFDVEYKLVKEWSVIGGNDFFTRRLPLSSPPENLVAPPSAIPPQTFSQVVPQPSPQRTFASVSDAFHNPIHNAVLEAAGTESTGSSYNPSQHNDVGHFDAARGPRFDALGRGLEGSPGQMAGYVHRGGWDNGGFRNDDLMYGGQMNGGLPSSPATSLSQPSHAAQQASSYGAIGGPRYGRGISGDLDFNRPLGSSALNQDPILGDVGIGRPIGQIVPRSRQTSYASERAWANSVGEFAASARLNGLPADPAVLSAAQGDYGAPRPQASRSGTNPSAWYYASQPQDDAAWGSAPPVEEHVVQTFVQEPAPIEALSLVEPTPVPVRLPTPPPPVATATAPAPPAEAAPKRAKSTSTAVAVPEVAFAAPVAPTIKPAVAVVVPAAATAASASPSPAVTPAQTVKPAWGKPEEITAKTKPTLRDIQEFEARQADAARKAAAVAAPRERPTTSRAATEEVTTITTSWGLPTSQAGQAPRATPKESSPQGTTSSVAWTSTAKPPVAAKKSVKQIQEEEEQRKRNTAKDAELIASAKRAYAQTANKTSAPAPNAWTTVGTSGKPTTTATAPRPTSAGPSAAPVVRSVNGTPARPAASQTKSVTVVKPTEEQPFVAPSQDFLRWLREALKEVAQGNQEETMKFLLAFPVDPEDASVPEMIADVIYASSQTMDGRRFATEFLTRRKQDAQAKKGPVVATPSAKQTMVNEIVKAQPKSVVGSVEWKAAGGKKKRGKQ